MGTFSREEKELMRKAQFNKCAICGKPLGDDAHGDAIFRNHEFWLNGRLVHPECHRRTRTYGTKPDPQNPLGY